MAWRKSLAVLPVSFMIGMSAAPGAAAEAASLAVQADGVVHITTAGRGGTRQVSLPRWRSGEVHYQLRGDLESLCRALRGDAYPQAAPRFQVAAATPYKWFMRAVSLLGDCQIEVFDVDRATISAGEHQDLFRLLLPGARSAPLPAPPALCIRNASGECPSLAARPAPSPPTVVSLQNGHRLAVSFDDAIIPVATERLGQSLKESLGEDSPPGKPIFVRVDPEVSYPEFYDLLLRLRSLGYDRVALISEALE